MTITVKTARKTFVKSMGDGAKAALIAAIQAA